MARGNQREDARAKNQAKQAQKLNATKKEGRPEDRNLADAQKLAAKVAAKQAAKEKEQLEESAGSSSNGPIVPKKKKVAKKDDTLDDLLSAGLSSKGKKK